MSKPSLTIVFDDNNRKAFQKELQDLIKKHNGIVTHYRTINKNEEDTHVKKSKFNKAQTSISTPEFGVTYSYRES
jgi:thioredoxin reductase|tara:strand:+ start:925 stop:1149 length:225 start_codon:yes stop_codon:yes gene_type:complete